jgi:capsular polysaccharide biosynthesis protein
LKNLKIINSQDIRKYAKDNNIELIFHSEKDDSILFISGLNILINGIQYYLPPLELHNHNSVILQMSDVIISGRNLAVIHKGNLIASGYSHSFNWVKYGEFIISSDGRTCIQPKKECIDLEGDDNSFILGITSHFGHFFTDCLDRLNLAKKANLDSKIFQYYSNGNPPSQVNDLIALLNSNVLTKLNFLDINKNYHVKNIYISSLNSRKPAISANSFLNLQKIAFNSISLDPSYKRFLFIGRKLVKKRKIMNQDEIIANLARQKFDVFFPEENSLLESIKAFNSASFIIIIIGSSKFNLAFCRPGTKVLCLTPEGYAENLGATSIMMRQICELFKLDLFFCACKVVGQNLGLDSDIHIDLNNLTKTINIMSN